MKALILVLTVLLSACVGNSPFRTADGVSCEHWSGCGSSYENNNGYDLGFIEYTERGNDFNPQETASLLKKIQAASDAGSVALVIFVHGWKHNASTEDGNVNSFKKALQRIAVSKVVGGKKIIGLYVGWRGMSFHGLGLENLTFWDRKSTAEEVGRGGVTELFLKLENITAANQKNFMITIGHSFGGAITLTALHDTLLSKMAAIERGKETKAFGDGVILLNPAIEANQALLLKEHSMSIGAMAKKVPSIMYVVSSQADIPTNYLFPLGQFFGVNVRTNQVDIKRRYLGRDYVIREQDLDTQTVGNYGMFTTGVMNDREFQKIEAEAVDVVKAERAELKRSTGSEKPSGSTHVLSNMAQDGSLGIRSLEAMPLEKWTLENRCSRANKEFGIRSFPCSTTDPIDFVSVPESFIENHNEIYGDSVISLLSVLVMKSLVERNKDNLRSYCANEQGFSFENCFSHYYKLNTLLTDAEAAK